MIQLLGMNGRKSLLLILFISVCLSLFYGIYNPSFSLVVLVMFFAYFLISSIIFTTSNRRKLFLISLTSGGFKISYLGRILDLPSPAKKSMTLRKSYFADNLELTINDDFYNINLIFKDAYNIINDCIFGKIDSDKKDRKGVQKLSFQAMCTRDSFDKIFASQDVLVTIHDEINRVSEDKIKRLQASTQAMVETTENLDVIQNQVIVLMRRMNSGLGDFVSLLGEVFGIHPDEVNLEVANSLIQNHKRKANIAQLVREGKYKEALKDMFLGDSDNGSSAIS